MCSSRARYMCIVQNNYKVKGQKTEKVLLLVLHYSWGKFAAIFLFPLVGLGLLLDSCCGAGGRDWVGLEPRPPPLPLEEWAWGCAGGGWGGLALLPPLPRAEYCLEFLILTCKGTKLVLRGGTWPALGKGWMGWKAGWAATPGGGWKTCCKGRVILVQILPNIFTRCRLSNIKKKKNYSCEKSRQNEKSSALCILKL